MGYDSKIVVVVLLIYATLPKTKDPTLENSTSQPVKSHTMNHNSPEINTTTPRITYSHIQQDRTVCADSAIMLRSRRKTSTSAITVDITLENSTSQAVKSLSIHYPQFTKLWHDSPRITYLTRLFL